MSIVEIIWYNKFGDFMNYVISGSDYFLVNAELDKIKKIYEKESLDLVQYDASLVDLQVIIDDANMPTFFADYKMIVVNHPLFLASDGKLDEKVQELLLQYLENPNPTTVVVFVLHKALDARKTLVKKIRKLCDCRIIDEVNINDFTSQVHAEIKKHKLKIDNKAMKELLSRLPLDYENLRQQIRKLVDYDGDITVEVVKSLVNRPLFGTNDKDHLLFTNAILSKDMETCFTMWKDLCITNKEPYSLIGLIASQFRFMYEVKYLYTKRYLAKDIAEYLHANEYRVSKTLETLNKYKLDDLSEILHALGELDMQIKSGVIDAKNGFELFLLQVTRRDKTWSH